MSETERTMIRTANRKMTDAIASGDAMACAQWYTPDACLMVQGVSPFEGRQAIANAYEYLFTTGVREEQQSTLEIDVMGDTAIEVVDWTTKGEGGAVIDSGRCLIVWKKTAVDGWLTHRVMSISAGEAS